MSISLSPAQPGVHYFTFCNFLKINDAGQLKAIQQFLALALINLWDEKIMSCQDGSQCEHY